MNICYRLSTIAIVLGGLVAPLHANWTSTVLHPPGSAQSAAIGGSGGTAYGFVEVAGSFRATYWSGPGFNPINLNQAGWEGSAAYAGDGTRQFGQRYMPNFGSRAGFWTGTADSWVDLQPAGFDMGAVVAFGGGKFGGFLGNANAAVWHSPNANDYTLLTPAGATTSWLYAMQGDQQGGEVDGKAALWQGTAGSAVYLNPTGATSSEVRAIDGNTQAGSANINGTQHASLWTGTAASWLSLNPAGATSGEVRAAAGGFQVGSATLAGSTHARIWQGSVGSAINLHSFLPAEYIASRAYGISVLADRIEVYGTAKRSQFGADFAVMWTQPVPEPGTLLAIGTGLAAMIARRRRNRS